MLTFWRELRWDLHGNRSNAALSYAALLAALLSFTLVTVLGKVGGDSTMAKTAMVDGIPVAYAQNLSHQAWSLAKVDTLAGEVDYWNQSGLVSAVELDFASILPEAASHRITIRATTPHYRQIRRLIQVSGRWPDTDPYPGQVAINQALRNLLHNPEQLRITMPGGGQAPFQIAGVVEDGLDQPMAYMGLTAFFATTTWRPAPSNAVVLFHPSTPDDAIINAAAANLPRLGVAAESHPVWVDHEQEVKLQAGLITALFSAVTIIGLLVATLGMVNVGLASVRERARDFTIRRALGASRGRVIGQVVASTLLIGILATGTALGLAYVATILLVPKLIPQQSGVISPTFPWLTAGIAALVGLAISLLSGLMPALRTRSLDLASLLRE